MYIDISIQALTLIAIMVVEIVAIVRFTNKKGK